MYELSRLFLDNKISRRSFMTRLTQAGISVAGAASIANALAAKDRAMPDAAAAPEKGRILEDLTGGELMAEFLIDWDVAYVFGLAGSEEVGFLDALVDRPALQYATCLHESAAMAMADGYSRSTGRTPIVQLHSVAGAAYALGQLAGSFRDNMPVVVMAGRQSANFRGQDGFLEAANLHHLPQDYARWTWDLMSAETMPETMRRAFLLAEAPPGGPTFVTMSKDLQEQRVPVAEILPRSRSRVATEVAPRDEHVQRIADALLDAELPVLFLGNEAIRHDISDEVAGIAEEIGALVMTATKIPVVYPNTHPNYVEQLHDNGSIAPDIDAFWSLGAPMFKTGARPSKPLIPRSATVMHTSLVPSEVGRNYPVDIASIASIKTTSAAVLDEIRGRDKPSSAIRERQRWIGEYSAKRIAALDKQAKSQWKDAPISTPRLMVELDRSMEPDAHVVTEIVSNDRFVRKYLTFDHQTPADRRRRNHDTVSGILGWGVAASIGVKIGNPDREVWCLTGDGAINFGSQALWSAVRYEVPIGVIVFNNGQYQANRFNQNLYQGRMLQTGKYIGVDLGHPDISYVKMAETYGLEGERVEDPDKVAAALKRCQEAMREGRPYLVDVKIGIWGAGSDSSWYDFFSVARNEPRKT
jgi:thiamine pyrophosphate-dependent acetolactate synthase large subunit-like protein